LNSLAKAKCNAGRTNLLLFPHMASSKKRHEISQKMANYQNQVDELFPGSTQQVCGLPFAQTLNIAATGICMNPGFGENN